MGFMEIQRVQTLWQRLNALRKVTNPKLRLKAIPIKRA